MKMICDQQKCDIIICFKVINTTLKWLHFKFKRKEYTNLKNVLNFTH